LIFHEYPLRRSFTRNRRYHSHPTFQPKPSSKDNSNQHNYQALFRDAASGLEPFVGVIYGPYDLMLPDATSARTVFTVQQKSGTLAPYNIK
jgi:protein MYSM1